MLGRFGGLLSRSPSPAELGPEAVDPEGELPHPSRPSFPFFFLFSSSSSSSPSSSSSSSFFSFSFGRDPGQEVPWRLREVWRLKRLKLGAGGSEVPLHEGEEGFSGREGRRRGRRKVGVLLFLRRQKLPERSHHLLLRAQQRHVHKVLRVLEKTQALDRAQERARAPEVRRGGGGRGRGWKEGRGRGRGVDDADAIVSDSDCPRPLVFRHSVVFRHSLLPRGDREDQWLSSRGREMDIRALQEDNDATLNSFESLCG